MEMWFSEFHTPDVKHSIRVEKMLYSQQSNYQRIDNRKRCDKGIHNGCHITVRNEIAGRIQIHR